MAEEKNPMSERVRKMTAILQAAKKTKEELEKEKEEKAKAETE